MNKSKVINFEEDTFRDTHSDFLPWSRSPKSVKRVQAEPFHMSKTIAMDVQYPLNSSN